MPAVSKRRRILAEARRPPAASRQRVALVRLRFRPPARTVTPALGRRIDNAEAAARRQGRAERARRPARRRRTRRSAIGETSRQPRAARLLERRDHPRFDLRGERLAFPARRDTHRPPKAHRLPTLHTELRRLFREEQHTVTVTDGNAQMNRRQRRQFPYGVDRHHRAPFVER